MALGKTITYTPFGEQSFAYGSTELATNYSTEFPNADTIVKVVIEHSSGNWNDDGHISTPSSGTAVALYNKKLKQWVCKGERSDVDAVLSQLVWYPADAPTSRPKDDENTSGFQVLAYKLNETDGQYTLEDPPAIGDTIFTIKAYDSSNVVQVSESLTFEPVEPTYDNQRPYFSTEPSNEDYSSTSYDSTDGYNIDLGTISHGTDTESVSVMAYFSEWSEDDPEIVEGSPSDSFIASDIYGGFLGLDEIYVADKISDINDEVSEQKFSITGSVAECQAFLDNLRYKTKDNNQKKTFDLHLRISDGVVGSIVKKTMWHSQDLTIVPTSLPDQHFIEDATARFDLGSIGLSNLGDLTEVNSFKAVITLDATGTAGATSLGTTETVDTETYSSGVLTIIDSHYGTFLTALRNLEFVPAQDFADDFTFTVQITAQNTTVGSSYTHTAKTVNVTAQEQAEVINITKTHNWNEDQVYYFKENDPLQIIHPYNENFRVEFDFQATGGVASVSDIGDLQFGGTDVTKTTSGDIITLTGTRDHLNTALVDLKFVPATDYDQTFYIDPTVTRTSGSNLANADVSTGVWTMSATAQEEYSYVDPGKYSWDEDVTLDFKTGLTILDTSLDDPLLPAYGAKFKLTLRAKYDDNSSVSTDDLQWSCFSPTNCTVSGSGTVADPLVIEGDRVDMNIAMNALRMTPAADFTATQGFRFEYRLERGTYNDSFYAQYVNYNKSVLFDKGTPSDEYTAPATVKFGLERITPIDGYEIVDVAENKEYTLNFTIGNSGEGFLRATQFGSATVEWVASEKRLKLFGTKKDVNQVLRTLEYVPTFGFSTNFSIFFYQYQNTDGITQATGGDAYFSMEYDSTLAKYHTDTTESLFYEEDTLNQRNILFYTELENLDGAEDITDDPIHYVTTLRLNPTTQIYFTNDYAEDGVLESDVVETRGSELTFTGSRKECNNIIKNMAFSAYADQIGDVDIHYSQERFRNNKFDETQADDVVGVDRLRCSGDVGEVLFSPWKQYFTTENAVSETGEAITQRYLQEYQTDRDGDILNRYTAPMQIIDSASEPEGDTLYKLEMYSSNLPDGCTIANIDYKTKEQFHEAIKDGIPIVAEKKVEELAYNLEDFKVHMRVTRKLPSGTETVLEENFLTYTFTSRPLVVHFDSDFDWKNRSQYIFAQDYTLGNDSILYKNNIRQQMQNGDATDTTVYENLSDYYAWVYRGQKGIKNIYGNTNYNVLNDAVTDTMIYNQYKDETVFENTSNGNLSYTIDTKYRGATRSYKVFQISASELAQSQTLTHSFTNRFGLKSTVTINYKESVVKYSEHMSHSQVSDVVRWQPDQGTLFGHDTGAADSSRAGSWTIDESSTFMWYTGPDVVSATLCSHFWVSPKKYAFKFINTFYRPEGYYARERFIPRAFRDNYWIYDSRDSVTPKLAGEWNFQGSVSVISDQSTQRRYITPPDFTREQVVGSGNRTDFLKKPGGIQPTGNEYAFYTRIKSDKSTYKEDNHSSILISDHIAANFGGTLPTRNSDINLDRAYDNFQGYKDFTGDYVTDYRSSQAKGHRSDYGNRGYGDAMTSTLFFDELDTYRATATIFQLRAIPGYAGVPDRYVPVIGHALYNSRLRYERDITNSDIWSKYAYSGEWAQDFAYPSEYILDTPEYPYQWFDTIPNSILDEHASNSRYNASSYFTSDRREALKNVTWDFAITKHVKSTNTEIGVNDKYAEIDYIPETVMITRSYIDTSKSLVHNEAIILKASGDWSEHSSTPQWLCVAKFKDTSYYKTATEQEKMRWARKNPKDNTSRILYDEASKTFFLPSGIKITETQTNLWEKSYVNTHKIGGEVDKWMHIPGWGVSWVDVNKGVIQQYNGTKKILLDTSLGTNTEYNYIYITKDSTNNNLLYAMLAYVDTGNTITGDADVLRSRLVYINLEEI